MSTAFYIALVLSTLAGAAALWHGIPPKKVRALVIFVFLAAAVVQGVVFSLGERRVIRDALLGAIPAIRVPPPASRQREANDRIGERVGSAFLLGPLRRS